MCVGTILIKNVITNYWIHECVHVIVDLVSSCVYDGVFCRCSVEEDFVMKKEKLWPTKCETMSYLT